MSEYALDVHHSKSRTDAKGKKLSSWTIIHFLNFFHHPLLDKFTDKTHKKLIPIPGFSFADFLKISRHFHDPVKNDDKFFKATLKSEISMNIAQNTRMVPKK